MADPSAAQEICMQLVTIMVRGNSMRRRVHELGGLSLASTAAEVKLKLRGMLAEPPDGIDLLVGGDTVEDAVALSAFGAGGLSRLQALVSYSRPTETWDWRPPAEDGVQVQGEVKARHFASDPGPSTQDDPCSPDVLAVEHVPRQLPPPLLMQPRGNPHEPDRLVTAEEQAGVARQSLFEIAVRANVFLGMSTHRRSCVIAASGQTRVAEVEARLEAWLGARPDELTLMHGSSALESNETLRDLSIGPGACILAMAWYQHASRRDLDPRASRRMPSATKRGMSADAAPTGGLNIGN